MESGDKKDDIIIRKKQKSKEKPAGQGIVRQGKKGGVIWMDYRNARS
jgi:hypothetical protein